MCAITGLIQLTNSTRPVSPQTVKRMADAQIHRGPDEAGHFCDPGIALGHRRLSLVCRENGRQPIQNEDGSIVVVANGEFFRSCRKAGLSRKQKSPVFHPKRLRNFCSSVGGIRDRYVSTPARSVRVCAVGSQKMVVNSGARSLWNRPLALDKSGRPAAFFFRNHCEVIFPRIA